MSIIDVNSKGRNLQFSINLIKQNKFEEKTSSLSLDPGVIQYLEVEDSLIEMGLKGNVIIDNKYKMTDRDGNVNDNTFIDINIIDNDSQDPRVGNKVLSFLSIIEKSSSTSESILNSQVIYKLEEAASSLLKKATLHSIDLYDNDETDNITGHMRKILDNWQKIIFKNGSGNRYFINEGDFATAEETGDFISFRGPINDSLYSILDNMANNITINGKLPILKIKTTDSGGRRLSLNELFSDRHIDFLRALKQRGQQDFSDVYLEEYTIAPLTSDESTPLTQVQDFQIVNSDIETARNKYWGDYQLDFTSNDLVVTNIQRVDFADIVSSFESVDLQSEPPYFSNIPLLEKIEKKLFPVSQDNNIPMGGDTLLRNKVFNTVKKSFLCLGETAVLTVPGTMYRTPGKFITIKGDSGKFKHPWLVTSVKHIFNGLDYTNEITAVRLFGNKKAYSELYQDFISSETQATPVLTNIIEAAGDAVEGLKQIAQDATDFVAGAVSNVKNLFNKE